MTALSAWCQMAAGITRHDAQHRVCEMRIAAGWIDACGCPDHRESSTVERDSRHSAIESETKRGPDRANESDPLATVSTRPKGA